MTQINILFSRFSAFYTPLLATIKVGFLEDEGLEPSYAVAQSPLAARAALSDGTAHLSQSAVSSSWGPLERGEPSTIVHFAQINERDGFFLAGRVPEPDFAWGGFEGKRVLVDHGAQPLAMFRFALHRMGVDDTRIEMLDAGGADAMGQAFRVGEGDYVHLQGPGPQQIEVEGAGHIVASVGEAIGPVAFSSLAATREWLGSDMAKAFMRAYRRSRRYVNETPAAEIAASVADDFPEVDRDALSGTLATYQRLGCWNPAPEITRELYEVSLDVFLHSGRIATRHRYEDVIVPPPDEA